MGNSVMMTGGGELDNGMTVAISFEMDQGTGNNSSLGFDNHSVSIGSDALGTLVLSGHGGSSAQSAMDTTAAGDLWNNTLGITARPAAAAAGNNSLFYTLPTVMDGVAITASMSPRGAVANQPTHTAYGVSYTGVEGLTVNYAKGDSGVVGSKVESTSMSASYAVGAFTAGYSVTDDNSSTSPEIVGIQLGYTVSDDLSVTYGQETISRNTSGVDQEVEGLTVSYTTGGMTITAKTLESKNEGYSSGAKSEKWVLGASFAF
jgi:outer membrane protein OmpU